MKKEQITAFLTILAAVASIAASGCSGQSISQVPDTSNTVSTTMTTTGTTVKTTLTTRPAQFTSCTTVTTRENNASIVEELLYSMTLEDKIYQMFIVTPEALTHYNGSATEAGSLTKEALENIPIGGLVYFSQNIENWYQVYDMLYTSQQYAQESNNNIGLFLAVDEEGGEVARISEKLGTYSSHDMAYYGDLGNIETVYNLGNTIGYNLSELGFNLNLAPVADVNINSENELGDRIFSDDPYVVADMTAQFVKGVEDTGISATLKHFPGLGAGTGDTHKSSVVVDRTIDELWNTEFVAFQGGISAEADFVMVGHQITTASGDNLPGDLSPVVVTEWLKTDLGYDGLVITDSQSMGAITENYTPGDAAVKSILAGVDIILMPYDLNNAVTGIQDAIANGTITEERINESVRKILTKKYELGIIDIVVEETSTTSTTT